jgi:hypothetical protein
MENGAGLPTASGRAPNALETIIRPLRASAARPPPPLRCALAKTPNNPCYREAVSGRSKGTTLGRNWFPRGDQFRPPAPTGIAEEGHNSSLRSAGTMSFSLWSWIAGASQEAGGVVPSISTLPGGKHFDR